MPDVLAAARLRSSAARWQVLYLRPLPHQQRSFLRRAGIGWASGPIIRRLIESTMLIICPSRGKLPISIRIGPTADGTLASAPATVNHVRGSSDGREAFQTEEIGNTDADLGIVHHPAEPRCSGTECEERDPRTRVVIRHPLHHGGCRVKTALN